MPNFSQDFFPSLKVEKQIVENNFDQENGLWERVMK